MSHPKLPPPLMVEITIISADGRKTPSPLFSLHHRPLRPFVTVSTAPAQRHYKTTRAGGELLASNPIYFGNVFRIPFDASCFPDDGCFFFLRLFSKRLLFGPALIGWCRMPAVDIGQAPVGLVRHLSYRLRKRDGSRSGVIVNLAVKVESIAVAGLAVEACRTVIGVPVAAVELRGSR